MDQEKKHVDLLIIGGGPAGLAAAVEAYDRGIRDILILERDDRLGGILNQCIHAGFGLHVFREELTGPEYAAKFVEMVEERGIPYLLHCMVLHLGDHCVTAVCRERGLIQIACSAVVLAMGCRERPRGAIGIYGTRPAGIFTAGTAQRLMNLDGYRIGKKVVILGSGDIGLIMARRMTLEGAEVKMVCEIEPYSNGLTRNLVQCLDDFHIPLRLAHTVTAVHGGKRLTSVTVARVDAQKRVIPGTEEEVECDTLLLSVGLIPENELSREAGIALDGKTRGPLVTERMQTTRDWVFACGNVVHVHDLVDYVTEEARRAGRAAAGYVRAGGTQAVGTDDISVRNGKGLRYVVPQKISLPAEEDVFLYFRSDRIYEDATVELRRDGKVLASSHSGKIVPSEMQKFRIGKEEAAKLRDDKTGEIELSVLM